MSIVDEIAEVFGLGPTEVLGLINTAPRRYKVYPIQKRGGGERIIAQPSRELKAIQRYVVSEKLSGLPVHPSATAYAEGASILENAKVHQTSRAILKLDFTNFFPSIVVSDWVRYARTSAPALLPEIHLYSRILFWGMKSVTPKCLSIGAPSSPILSNVLMFDLDTKLSKYAADAGLRYSRYADDITLSGETIEAVLKFETSARRLIEKTRSPKLVFNDQKRGLYLRGQRRMVTGLVITPSGEISMGRERKRLMIAMMHRVALGTATEKTRALLKGWLGFSVAVEPEFVGRLRNKYGDESVNQALRYHIPPRARA